MIKQTLTFDDLINGGTITEDWYFNLDVGELTEMMLVEGEDLSERLKQIGASDDRKEIWGFFKEMLSRSVGKQVTLDSGRTVFRKTKDITEEFFGGGAYSKFFLDLVSDEKLAAEFINSIMPKDLEDQARKMARNAAEKGGPEVAARIAAAGIDIGPVEGIAQGETHPDADDKSDEELRRMLEEDDATEQEDNRPDWLKELRKPTKAELKNMPREQLQLAMRLKSEGKLK